MVKYVGPVIRELLNKDESPRDIAEKLGVTTALISTWKNKENDFCPRIGVAAKIYKNYGIVVHPYGEESLKVWLDENS